MWTSLMFCTAVMARAAEIVVDARVPVDVSIDGKLLARLYESGIVHLPAVPGDHTLTLFVGGHPDSRTVAVPDVGSVSVLVGRNGISVDRGEPPVAVTGPSVVEIRVTGHEVLLVQVGEARHRLTPGQPMSFDLAHGDHRFIVWDASGTTLWARGQLRIAGPAVVQIAEGRLPEVSSSDGVAQGTDFLPDGN